MAQYIRTPFATAGDKTVIPDAAQGNGGTSKTQGYGPLYQADQDVDPNARDVERVFFNQLMFETQEAVQQLQQDGFPEFIPAAQNGGTAFAYDENAIVRSGTTLYQSLNSNNTTLPTDVNNWREVDLAANFQMEINGFGIWEATRTYNLNSVVRSGTSIYISLVPTNTAALTDPLSWRLLDLAAVPNSIALTTQYQQDGFPDYLATIAYDINAVVRSGTTLYLSIVDNNTDPLTDTASWRPLDFENQGFFANTVIFAGGSAGNWTVPAGIFNIEVELWGGGGGGTSFNTTTGSGGNGGSSGGYCRGNLAVEPGEVLAYSAGVGGAGVSGGLTIVGGNGSSSTFAGSFTASGGAGGRYLTLEGFGGGGASGGYLPLRGRTADVARSSGVQIRPSFGASAPRGGSGGFFDFTQPTSQMLNGQIPGGGGSGNQSGSLGNVGIVNGGTGASGRIIVRY